MLLGASTLEKRPRDAEAKFGSQRSERQRDKEAELGD